VVCMAIPRRKQRIRPKRGKRGMRYSSTSFRKDSFRCFMQYYNQVVLFERALFRPVV
jgi:hypothetical protein